MKKILSILLVMLMLVSVFAACNGKEVEETPSYDVESAAAFVKSMNKKLLSSPTQAADFKVPSQVLVDGVTYTVTWTTNTDKVTVSNNEKTQQTTVNVDEKSKENLQFELTATVTDPDGKTATLLFKLEVPKYAVNSWEEYADECDNGNGEKNITIIGYVTAVNSAPDSSGFGTMWVQDTEGYGYYVYAPALSDEEKTSRDALNAAYPVGTEVEVSGTVTLYNGCYEFNKGCSVTKTGNKVESADIPYIDATEAFGAAANNKDRATLDKYQSARVLIKGATLTKVDGSYYYFTVNGVEYNLYRNNYFFEDAQIEELFAKFVPGTKADITGVISVYSNAFQVYPDTVNSIAVSDVELTDAEKIGVEISSVTIDSTVLANKEIVLPATGSTYADVAIAWTSDNACAVVDGGKLTVTLPAEAQTVTLTAVYTLGAETKTVTYTIEVAAAPTLVPEIEAEPEADKAYLFYLVQGKAGKTLYLDGGVDGRYLTMTDDASKAIDVYAEAVEGGYKFYTLVEGAKQYIVIYNNESNKVSVKYDANAETATVYTYDATVYAWTANFNEDVYYLGTYNTFETVSASKTSYISADNTRVEQFPLELCTLVDAASAGIDIIDTPVAETEYKFYLVQAKAENKTLYLDGGVDGRYLTMTDDASKAINVYAEAVEGGYKFYTLVEGAKQYIVIYNNDSNKVSVKYDANAETATVYTYDATVYAWTTNFNEDVYYLGTYNTFETVSASKTSYINADNTRVEQFPLELITVAE